MKATWPGKWICPRCGASNPARSARCWICGEVSNPTGGGDDIGELLDSDVPVAAKEEARPDFQFHLTGLLLLIAVVALALGMYRRSPGLVILLGLVTGPALLATFGRSLIRRSKGRAMSGGEKVGTFFIGLGITLALFISLAVIAIIAACIAVAIICSNGPMFR